MSIRIYGIVEVTGQAVSEHSVVRIVCDWGGTQGRPRLNIGRAVWLRDVITTHLASFPAQRHGVVFTTAAGDAGQHRPSWECHIGIRWPAGYPGIRKAQIVIDALKKSLSDAFDRVLSRRRNGIVWNFKTTPRQGRLVKEIYEALEEHNAATKS